MDRCDICGTKLKEVNGRAYCANHGFVDVAESKEKECPDYIG